MIIDEGGAPGDLRRIAAELVREADRMEPTPGADRAIYRCRCCSATTGDAPIVTSGPVLPGWGVIERIDGPSAICPICVADPTALDGFLREYPNAAVRR